MSRDDSTDNEQLVFSRYRDMGNRAGTSNQDILNRDSLSTGQFDKKPTEKYERDTLRTDTNEIYQQKDGSFRHFISDVRRLYNEIEEEWEFKYLGIVFDTYIVIEKGDGIYFIDFHAAHERDIYNSLNKSRDIETQNLIFPQEIELSIEDYQLFLEKKDYFCDTGFDIDIFSDNSLIVRGIPDFIEDLNIEGFISDIIEAFKDNKDHVRDMNMTIAEKLACHSARRSGDTLSIEDAKSIAGQALNGDYEKRCPHGRPFLYKLQRKDLEKVFKRV
jgi:DNA mismatch repair protein MutL